VAATAEPPHETVIPLLPRVQLAHAVVQAVADEARADILHLKGPAVDPTLLASRIITDDDGEARRAPIPRHSTDADVLVRPSQVSPLMTALAEHGWAIVTRFETGSAFEHAASLWHHELGYVDVHRRFPGIAFAPDQAFETLWSRRQVVDIAARPCAVPSVDDQRLILLLHAARGGGLRHPDVQRLWTDATPTDRERSLALASDLDARVGLAAATGRLDEFADDPTTPLWRIFAEGGTPRRLDEWLARFRATPGVLPRARLVARSLLVNTDHLAMDRRRPLTRTEVAGAYLQRARAAGREVAAAGRRGLERLKDGGRR
jgi:Uncharacterised nucleotidyltransferase